MYRETERTGETGEMGMGERGHSMSDEERASEENEER